MSSWRKPGSMFPRPRALMHLSDVFGWARSIGGVLDDFPPLETTDRDLLTIDFPNDDQRQQSEFGEVPRRRQRICLVDGALDEVQRAIRLGVIERVHACPKREVHLGHLSRPRG